MHKLMIIGSGIGQVPLLKKRKPDGFTQLLSRQTETVPV